MFKITYVASNYESGAGYRSIRCLQRANGTMRENHKRHDATIHQKLNGPAPKTKMTNYG